MKIKGGPNVKKKRQGSGRRTPHHTHTMAGFEFHKKFPDVAQRRDECTRIRAKYPDRIPVVAERDARAKDIPKLTRTRYLVPNDLTTGQFVFVLRKRLSLPPEKAVFIYVGSARVMPPSSMLMGACYLEHKNKDDGFLYVRITGEDTFG